MGQLTKVKIKYNVSRRDKTRNIHIYFITLQRIEYDTLYEHHGDNHDSEYKWIESLFFPWEWRITVMIYAHIYSKTQKLSFRYV